MHKNSGFGLIELLVVIGVVAVISAIATPGVLTWRANTKLRSAAEHLRGALQLAKSRAVRDGHTVIVELTADNYFIFVDTGNGGGGPANGKYDRQEPVVFDRRLPAGIRINLTALNVNSNDDIAGGIFTDPATRHRPDAKVGVLRNPDEKGKGRSGPDAVTGSYQSPKPPAKSVERRPERFERERHTKRGAVGTLLRKFRKGGGRDRLHKDKGSGKTDKPMRAPKPPAKQDPAPPPAESPSVVEPDKLAFDRSGRCINPQSIVLENSRGKKRLVAVNSVGNVKVINLN